MTSTCVVCLKDVRPRQHALECEMCLRWQHRLCGTSISIHQYRAINKGEISITFHCANCSIASANPRPERPAIDDMEAILHPIQRRRRPLPQLKASTPISSSLPELPPPPTHDVSFYDETDDAFPLPPPPIHDVSYYDVTDDEFPLPPSTSTQLLPTSTQPLPTSTQPLPSYTQPLPTSTQPLLTSTQPLPTSTQPLPTSTQPLPTSTQPLLTSTQPLLTSTQPLQTSTQQLQTSTQPSPTSTQPLPNSTQPLPNSTQPLPNSTQPLPNSPTQSFTLLQTDASVINDSFNISADIDDVNPINESDIQDELRNDTLLEDQPTTYQIVEKGTKQRFQKLVSSDGYSFTKKKSTQYSTYWTCSVRSKSLWCKASVTQRGDHFTPGIHSHIHPADPGLTKKTRIYASVLNIGSSDPYQSASKIVEDEMRKTITHTDFNLPKTTNLVRAVNRLRQKMRPSEPNDLTFEIDHSYLEDDDFFRGDVRVDDARHIIFASKTQLKLLEDSRRWYVDGTFKVVHQPFIQLFSIHAFIQKESCLKQIPLLFVLMSRRQKKDYDAVFTNINQLIPNRRVEAFTLDFEAAAWKSIQDIYPGTLIQGCSFHWGQAVMRKVANLGLKSTYDQRKTTHQFIKKILSLPLLPASHILPTYQSLRPSATTQQLLELLDYLDNTWLHNGIWSVQQWSVFRQTVRTNNDTEGWHRRFIGRAGGDKLHFYRLVPALKREAETVDITVQLVNEQQLTRYQRQTYKKTQQRLEDLWDKYEAKQIKTSAFLEAAGKLI